MIYSIVKKLKKFFKKRPFRVVSLLAVRNEEQYIERCLEHLIKQGIDVYIIDNDSEDNTRKIAEKFLGHGVIYIESFPYNGYFDLVGILQKKEWLSREIDADWFIHHDADEIREAPLPYKTLYEAICDVDKQGYNVINFDEFVFTPTDSKESFEGKDYVSEMEYYYFFEPGTMRRMNAWKKNQSISIMESGGHSIKASNLRVFSVNFILRHYIYLSKAYAERKYAIERKFSKKEIEERGWHGRRAVIKAGEVVIPSREILKRCGNDGIWDKSDPWKKHYFLHNGERY